MTRQRIDLAGRWERIVNGESWDFVHVPCSLRLAGTYILKRNISLSRVPAGARSYIHFEAITYYAEVTVNGTKLGHMGPYIPYEFESTHVFREGENTIEVLIRDLTAGRDGSGKDELAIGVNPGWEAYGGIIRETWIEIRPAVFIENVRLAYTVTDDFSRASCGLRVFLNAAAPADAHVNVSVLHGATEVAHGSTPVTLYSGRADANVEFQVEHPLLWSPAEPHLYTLTATLETTTETDVFRTRTGFRHFAINGRQFTWNGKPLYLQGLCRHDMWYDQGFTLTREQMKEDMRAIKAMGANFVRLVHYPHDRYIIDLAEELGLLVTEEPGYWQVEFPSMPASEIDAGLRILEGAIRRDWNSPAVFGWLLGNESRLTVDYLRRGKALCDELDPLRRPVSFANSTAKEKAKLQFEQAELDFFSQHLYEFDRHKFETTADYYGAAKPLVIDEWGWEDSGGGEIFWDRNFDALLDAMKEGKIAGHSFWSWNDMRQYARLDWPTAAGVLYSGVVTETRQPRTDLYQRLSLLFQWQAADAERERVPHTVPFSKKPRIVPLRVPIVTRRGTATPVDLQPVLSSTSARQSWQALEQAMAKFWAATKMARDQWERTGKQMLFWPDPTVEINGIPFAFPRENGLVRPIVVTPDVPRLSVPIAKQCDYIYLLGNSTLPSGYPLEGQQGAVAGSIEVVYRGRATQRVPLRNGKEIASANMIDDATRIEPIALNAPQALTFEKDPAREHYQILLFGFPTNGFVSELAWNWKSGAPLTLFAVTLQTRNAGEIAG